MTPIITIVADLKNFIMGASPYLRGALEQRVGNARSTP